MTSTQLQGRNRRRAASAVRACLDGELAGVGVVRRDEVLGAGLEVVEHVLLVGLGPLVSPVNAELTAAPVGCTIVLRPGLRTGQMSKLVVGTKSLVEDTPGNAYKPDHRSTLCINPVQIFWASTCHCIVDGHLTGHALRQRGAEAKLSVPEVGDGADAAVRQHEAEPRHAEAGLQGDVETCVAHARASAVKEPLIRSTFCWRPLLTHPELSLIRVYAAGPSEALMQGFTHSRSRCQTATWSPRPRRQLSFPGQWRQ